MAQKRPTKAMQEQCDRWNAKYPVGTPVMLKRDGLDEPIAAITRSTAQILSGHSVVIWLDGISGCYLLTHVRAAATDAQKAKASLDLKRKLVPWAVATLTAPGEGEER